MKYYFHWTFLTILAITCLLFLFHHIYTKGIMGSSDKELLINLPEPQYEGHISVEKALKTRRSIRNYKKGVMSIQELGQLLWAAQGITDSAGLRTAPSAGALFPIELFVAVGNVDGIQQGVYRYEPNKHRIIMILSGDKRNDICSAALGQDSIIEAQVVLIFTVVYERTMKKYKDRGIRYAQIEVGHASQNVYLQCISLKLGTVAIGAFYDDKVNKAIGADDKLHPLCIMPIGRI